MRPLLEYIDETESTNDLVARWVRQGCDDGRGLYAGVQRAGRGRLGRRWFAAPGADLALSIAVVGARYTPVLLQLPLAAGVGVIDALAQVTGLTPSLKWPNDVLVGDRKLGGILCEAVADEGRVLGAVVGIGVNVNASRDGLPAELRGAATTLFDETGTTHDVDALAGAVRISVMRVVDRLARPDVSGVLDAWRAADVTVGRAVRVDGRAGVAVGIAADGALEVDFGAGAPQAVRAGDVTFA